MEIKNIYKTIVSNKRISFWLTIVGLIIALLGSFYGPKIYYYFWGELKIDYKENEFLNKDGIDYAQIEVMNNLGYSLDFINGTVTLNCKNINEEYVSKTFELENNRDFLAHGTSSELLFVLDPTLINLAQTKNFHCADATLEIAEYIKINETNHDLNKLTIFEFFYGNENLTITKKDYNIGEGIVSRKCLDCNVIIKIYASNINKPYIENENHKFVSGSTTVLFSENIISPIPPKDSVGNLYVGNVFRSPYFPPCQNISSDQCLKLLYEKIKDTYEGQKFDWESSSYINFSSFPLMSDRIIRRI